MKYSQRWIKESCANFPKDIHERKAFHFLHRPLCLERCHFKLNSNCFTWYEYKERNAKWNPFEVIRMLGKRNLNHPQYSHLCDVHQTSYRINIRIHQACTLFHKSIHIRKRIPASIAHARCVTFHARFLVWDSSCFSLKGNGKDVSPPPESPSRCFSWHRKAEWTEDVSRGIGRFFHKNSSRHHDSAARAALAQLASSGFCRKLSVLTIHRRMCSWNSSSASTLCNFFCFINWIRGEHKKAFQQTVPRERKNEREQGEDFIKFAFHLWPRSLSVDCRELIVVEVIGSQIRLIL